MQLLDECLELRRAIVRLDERIEEINAKLYTPKNQIISDMPRSRSVESVTDKLLAKKELLTAEKKTAENNLNDKWNEIIKEFCRVKVSKQQAQLMYLRFNKGKSWKDCTLIMKKLHGFWNENKSFREYRSVLSKLHNKETQTA